MELMKRYVQINDGEREGQIQITLEEDLNLPETKPDIATICFEKGTVVTEEVRPAADGVSVKGKLVFSILYHTQESGGALERIDGKMPFEERIRMDGLGAMDEVCVSGCVDDLSVTMINSRKLGIQSVITLTAQSEGMRQEELPVGITEEDEARTGAQVRMTPLDFTYVCARKRDVLRVKEDLTLPNGYPNVGRILWKDAELGEMSFRPGEDKIYVQGEVRVFVLYESENETEPPQIYETVTNISSEIDCDGCREGMALDVRYGISQWDVTPKPDADGEQRELGLELTIELRISLYARESLDVVRDVYGVKREIREEERVTHLRQLVRCVTGKTKVSDHAKAAEGQKFGQIVHGEGEVSLLEALSKDGGMTLRGTLGVKVLYTTGEEENPYGCLRMTIPFEYALEIPGMKAGDEPGQLQARMEQLGITAADGEEMEVRAILSFSVSVFRSQEERVALSLEEEPLSREKMASLPSMVAYVVQEGDDLWSIGKRYYVPVEKMTEMNGLTGEELQAGQKLLIVKGGPRG